MMAVFGHVSIELILADNDEVHAVAGHRADDVGSSGEQMSDEIVGLPQCLVGYFGRGGHREALRIEIFSIELSSGFAVALTNPSEERFWWSGDWRGEGV